MREDEFRARAQALILLIVRAKAEAGALNMFETMHALESPMTKVGWELARILQHEHYASKEIEWMTFWEAT